MIIKTPAEIRETYGPLFSRRFLVMVDEKAGLAELYEECRARGTIEWDAANRMRAGGALISCRPEGRSMTMLARTGHYPVKFGASDREIGGQALEGVEVDGRNVITSWSGIAGAGVGIAACLPQAEGVIRAEYPSGEDCRVGGARVNRVRIVSPKYVKVTIGIDDTDTKDEGATWVSALRCAGSCPVEGAELLNMRLIQLNPAVPKKTTNCVGSALNFAVLPEAVDRLLSYVKEYIESTSVSDDTGIAVFQGIKLPYESDYPRRVKTEMVTLEEAGEEAARQGIRFIDDNGRKGRIGAVGAVLWANAGPEAAGLYGENL
ncbi:MAG: tRNA(Ile2) 2-agmatinylcytidine synthetase [Methanoculleaceae archaeon]